MTTQLLIDLLKGSSGNLLSMDLDSYLGESMTDAQAVTLLNQAKNVISRHIFQVNPNITFTVTSGSAVQNLQDTTVVPAAYKVIQCLGVIINNNPLYDTQGRVGMWSYADFQRYYPAWQTESSGTPVAAVNYQEGKIILHPKPSSSFANSKIIGQYLAADLSASSLSTEPDLPVDLHIAVGYLAASMAAEPSASVAEQLNRLDRYDRRYRKLMDEVRSLNMRPFSKSTFGNKRRLV